MAYAGLYVERCPNITAAGKVKPHEDVWECFVNVPLEDKMTALGLRAAAAAAPAGAEGDAALGFGDSQRRLGLYTRVSSLLRPPVRGGVGVVRDELLDTVYQSYWRKPLGRGSDPTPGLPAASRAGDVVTYGRKLPTGKPPASELVNPPDKPHLRVTLEAERGHDLYVVTHDAYFPGEQVRRRYERPGFDPEHRTRYGQRSGVDTSGVYVRKGIRWFADAASAPVSRLQQEHTRLRRARLGQAAQPNDVVGTCVPPDHTFGRSTVATHGVLEVMRGQVPAPPARAQQLRAVAHANALRGVLRRRRPGFPFQELRAALGAEPLALGAALDHCRRLHVCLDEALLRWLLQDLGALQQEDLVRPTDLLALIHHAQALPGELSKIHDAARPDPGQRGEPGQLPPGCPQAWSDMPTAGAPSDRKPQHFSLDASSHMPELLGPSVWTQYGLAPTDVFQLRPKEEVLRVLGAAGVVCPREVLDSLLETKPDHPEGLVSLEDVRSALAHKAAHRYLTIN